MLWPPNPNPEYPAFDEYFNRVHLKPHLSDKVNTVVHAAEAKKNFEAKDASHGCSNSC